MSKMKVSVAEAKNHFTQLIKAVEKGKTVTVTRRGKPVANIVRAPDPSAEKRVIGALEGKIVINDPDWWKPMTDEEAESFLETGDY